MLAEHNKYLETLRNIAHGGALAAVAVRELDGENEAARLWARIKRGGTARRPSLIANNEGQMRGWHLLRGNPAASRRLTPASSLTSHGGNHRANARHHESLISISSRSIDEAPRPIIKRIDNVAPPLSKSVSASEHRRARALALSTKHHRVYRGEGSAPKTSSCMLAIEKRLSACQPGNARRRNVARARMLWRHRGSP